MPNLTFKQVREKQLDISDLNYLKKAMLYGGIKEASAARETRMKKKAAIFRERDFSTRQHQGKDGQKG